MRYVRRVLVVCCLAVLVCGVSADSPRTVGMIEPESKALAGQNALAFDLFRRFTENRTEDENLFFSPTSLASVLAMTSAGARGDTQREILDVLHTPDDAGLQKAMGKLLDRVRDVGARA
mgnify:CR=1 FL=1